MVKTTEIPEPDGAVMSKKYYCKLMKNYLLCFSLSTDENDPFQEQADRKKVGCYIPCQ